MLPVHTRVFAVSAVMSGVAVSAGVTTMLHAAELQVLAGGAMTAPMKELAARFESACHTRTTPGPRA